MNFCSSSLRAHRLSRPWSHHNQLGDPHVAELLQGPAQLNIKN